MTTASEDSCTQWEEHNSSLSTHLFAEDQHHYLEEKQIPGIVAVFNGKELGISEELITEALSGISVKHYDGNCLPVEEPGSDILFYGEDYPEFEYEERVPSKTMSSMIRLCYEPKKRSTVASENAPEDVSDYSDKPLCLQGQINFRNSFWNLHRPELCKMTWPHDYVGEATVTQHLHRHLLSHGAVCSEFHEQRDLLAMLDKELDLYDKLKTIQSPREIPQDEEEASSRPTGIGRKPRKYRLDPCRPVFKPPPIKEDNNEDLEPSQVVRPSKEEFCITIGHPVRRKTIRHGRIDSASESQRSWLPYDEGEMEGAEEYTYPDYCTDSTLSSEAGECEADAEAEQTTLEGEEESATMEPPAWVEPDFCAMI